MSLKLLTSSPNCSWLKICCRLFFRQALLLQILLLCAAYLSRKLVLSVFFSIRFVSLILLWLQKHAREQFVTILYLRMPRIKRGQANSLRHPKGCHPNNQFPWKKLLLKPWSTLYLQFALNCSNALLESISRSVDLSGWFFRKSATFISVLFLCNKEPQKIKLLQIELNKELHHLKKLHFRFDSRSSL